jgi:hypothetical protein
VLYSTQKQISDKQKMQMQIDLSEENNSASLYKYGAHGTLTHHTENQGHINLFRFSRDNMKHGQFTLWWRIAFNFQCKLKGKELAHKNTFCEKKQIMWHII